MNSPLRLVYFNFFFCHVLSGHERAWRSTVSFSLICKKYYDFMEKTIIVSCELRLMYICFCCYVPSGCGKEWSSTDIFFFFNIEELVNRILGKDSWGFLLSIQGCRFRVTQSVILSIQD